MVLFTEKKRILDIGMICPIGSSHLVSFNEKGVYLEDISRQRSEPDCSSSCSLVPALRADGWWKRGPQNLMETQPATSYLLPFRHTSTM